MNLDEIRQRADAATEGPWAIWRDLDHQGFYTVGDEAGVIPDGALETEGECNPTAHVYVEEDAEFIAHARTDVPALVEEVERLRARLDAAKRVQTSRLDAGRQIDAHMARGDGADIVFYAGASLALAHVNQALRGERR